MRCAPVPFAHVHAQLVPPDMNESVRGFITRLLNMPVSRSRGPYNADEWGIWSEAVRLLKFTNDAVLCSMVSLCYFFLAMGVPLG